MTAAYTILPHDSPYRAALKTGAISGEEIAASCDQSATATASPLRAFDGQHQLHLVSIVDKPLLDFLQTVGFLADVHQLPQLHRPPPQQADRPPGTRRLLAGAWEGPTTRVHRWRG